MHHAQQRHAPVVAHHQPADLDAALALLARPGARPVAGGTDLLLELERGARTDVTELVDLTRVPGLSGIEVDGDELVLGALVTHNEVVASTVAVADALPLAQACLEVGGPPLRNRATVVGNVVTASPANDTLSALLALDATAELASATGTRRLPVAELVTGFRTTALAPGELVTALRVPRLADGARGLFAKLGNRRAQAISIVHLAVVLDLDGDRVRSARLAVGSVAPTVVRLTEAEGLLACGPLDDDAVAAAAAAARAAVRPIDDIRASAAYRSEAVEVLVRRVLVALRDGQERSGWPARVVTLGGRGHRDGVGGVDGGCSHGPDDAVRTVVNGEPVAAAGAAGHTLLDWLRERPGPDGAPLTGTKEGCAEGECGACTILLDGQAVLACLVPAARAHGAEVTTVEGLAGPDGLHPLQQGYVDRSAVQCGYCIPGFLVAGSALLAEVPSPDPDDLRRGLAGNLCRCTGYDAMFSAFADAAGTAVAVTTDGEGA